MNLRSISFVALSFCVCQVRAGIGEGNLFIRGDFNRDGVVDISDPLMVIRVLFAREENLDRPLCHDAADANDDGQVNIADPIYLLNFLFLGEKEPHAPFPEKGWDPTFDQLGC